MTRTHITADAITRRHTLLSLGALLGATLVRQVGDGQQVDHAPGLVSGVAVQCPADGGAQTALGDKVTVVVFHNVTQINAEQGGRYDGPAGNCGGTVTLSVTPSAMTCANVGLANVDDRLRAAFGNDYGLVVETAPGAGTKVSMRVPKFKQGIHV